MPAGFGSPDKLDTSDNLHEGCAWLVPAPERDRWADSSPMPAPPVATRSIAPLSAQVTHAQQSAVLWGSILLNCRCADSASASCELVSRRHLTALVLGADGDEERYRENFEVAESSEGDEHIAALVQAVPQLRALKLFDYGTDLATDAGQQGPTDCWAPHWLRMGC